MRLLILALLTGLALAGELDEAKRLLDSRLEGDVKRGTALCATANNAAGADALLVVLRRTERGPGLADEHFRDIVWEGLLALKDPYARGRIEHELRTNRKSAAVRMWCAELLGLWGDASFAPALVAACADKDDGVKQWAARSLGMLKYEPATKALEPLTRHRDPYVRANAIEALARIRPEKERDRFLYAVARDADGGVRCALLGALPEIYADAAFGTSVERGREDEDWRPRMQAVDNLAGMKTKEAVDALVLRAMDGRPVVAERAMESLRRMTGKDLRIAEEWGTWWHANREAFSFPEAVGQGEEEKPPAERRTVAYGIPIASDHVAFVIDTSARMADKLKATGTSKSDAAREELARVLGELHGRLVFNVYAYREEIDAFRKKPVPLDPKQQEKAISFLKEKTTAGAKDIWNVLDTVVTDPDIDTIYLLSSGEPDVGLYVHWNRVTSHLADLNRFHKVVVHTVVYSERQWFRDQLEKIAEVTGGRFKAFE